MLVVRFWKIGVLSFIAAAIIGPFMFVATVTALENVFNDPSESLSSSKVDIPEPISLKALAYNDHANIKVRSALIIQVLDFNTVNVLLNDGMEEISLIGVSENDSCSEENVIFAIQNMVLGQKVYLVDDQSLNDDAVNHKYLFTDDLKFLNQELIKQGILNADKSSSYIYKEDFLKLEKTIKDCSLQNVPAKKLTAVHKDANEIDNLYSRLLTTATPIPTSTPTPSPSPTPFQTIAENNQNNTSKPQSLNPEILFALINSHRASIGKPSFEKDDKLCSLAVSRGPELYDEIFVNYNVHAGLNSRNIPFWITENMAHYETEEQVFNWWMGSSLHRSAIEGDFKYSCGECYGNSCAQLFTNWTPK